MPERLNPDGVPVQIEEVEIVSPGLRGWAEVHRPSGGGMRAAEGSTGDFLAALRATDMVEQLTLEIAEPEELVDYGSAEVRSTAQGDPALELTMPGPGTGFGQVLLYADEDGVLSWHLPDDIRGEQVSTRSGDRRTYTISREVATTPSPGHRGLVGALGKKVFKILAFALVDKALGTVGDHFVDRWERSNRPHRLRPFTPLDYTESDAPDLSDEELARLGEGPALLFIHGTFSRADMAFGRLPGATMAQLHTRYGSRVFAFDHPTVGTAPRDNVEWLAQHLASRSFRGRLEVDIVSHSRGGLVGRLLTEQPRPTGLSTDLLDVRQLIMVATPNSGTALASRGRVGDLLDIMTNILEFVPDNPVTGTMEVLLIVLKQLATGVMGGLDGLTSMDPRGPFLAELNRHPDPRGAVYRTVSSNFRAKKGATLGRWARDRVTDGVFLGDPNDLIVPTGGVSTFGSPACAIREEVLFEGDHAVDHSSYWAKDELIDAFDRWLPGA